MGVTRVTITPTLQDHVSEGSWSSYTETAVLLKQTYRYLCQASELLNLTELSGFVSTSPLTLEFDQTVPADGNATNEPLVILHGLL